MHGSSCSVGMSVCVVDGVLLLCDRLLGVSKETSFEEIQDARNYLFEVRGVSEAQ